jgi:hypothetical protein
MTDVETRGTFQVIRDVLRDIHAAEDDLRTEHDAALRRYVERVDAILAFGVPVAEHADDDDHSPTQVVDALRGHLGELRVRTHLGTMDAEDLVQRVRAALRRLAS